MAAASLRPARDRRRRLKCSRRLCQGEVLETGRPCGCAATRKIGGRWMCRTHLGQERIQDACPVCLEPMAASGGGTCLQLQCSHVFHYDCIAAWARQGDTCPTCRKPFALSDVAALESCRMGMLLNEYYALKAAQRDKAHAAMLVAIATQRPGRALAYYQDYQHYQHYPAADEADDSDDDFDYNEEDGEFEALLGID